MTAKQMWNKFKTMSHIADNAYDSWAFGDEPDMLASLVLHGKKTATASVYELYELDGEELPKAGTYSVIMDSKDHAVCIIKDTAVTVVPFRDVDEEQARLEGEGDLSLDYWRDVHRQCFSEWMKEEGLTFTDDTKVVLERFEVVYRP